MKRKALSAFLIAMLSGGVAFADTEQTVYVNGQETGGFVTSLTFSGNNVTMTFEDEASQKLKLLTNSATTAYTQLADSS